MIAALRISPSFMGRIEPQKSTQDDRKLWGHLDDTGSFKGQRKTRGSVAAVGREERRVTCGLLAGWVERPRAAAVQQEESCGHGQREERSDGRWLAKSSGLDICGRWSRRIPQDWNLALPVSVVVQQDRPLGFVPPPRVGYCILHPTSPQSYKSSTPMGRQPKVLHIFQVGDRVHENSSERVRTGEIVLFIVMMKLHFGSTPLACSVPSILPGTSEARAGQRRVEEARRLWHLEERGYCFLSTKPRKVPSTSPELPLQWVIFWRHLWADGNNTRVVKGHVGIF